MTGFCLGRGDFFNILEATFSKLKLQSDYFYRYVENVIYRLLIAVSEPGDSRKQLDRADSFMKEINRLFSLPPIFSEMFTLYHH